MQKLKKIATVSLLLLLSFSCSKEITTSSNNSDNLADETKSEKVFQLSLSSPLSINTRAFFDDTSSLELWEKEPKGVS
ncbi:MAG: hypothetical protein R3Y50_10225 [Rikenellaceae bacterium]